MTQPVFHFPHRDESPGIHLARFMKEAPESFVYVEHATSEARAKRWPYETYMEDPVQHLVDMLADHTLDPRFEEFGNFSFFDRVHHRTEQPLFPLGTVCFWGNFFDFSYVFRLSTNHPETIERLTAVIRANQATPAYLQAKAEREAQKQKAVDRAQAIQNKTQAEALERQLRDLQHQLKQLRGADA